MTQPIIADGGSPLSADFRANILFPTLNVRLVERALRPPETPDNQSRLECLYQPSRDNNPITNGMVRAIDLARGPSPSNPLADLLQRELYEQEAGRLNLGSASEEQAPNSLLTITFSKERPTVPA